MEARVTNVSRIDFGLDAIWWNLTMTFKVIWVTFLSASTGFLMSWGSGGYFQNVGVLDLSSLSYKRR